MKVVKMERKQDVYKIEGDAFKRVLSVVERIESGKSELKRLFDELEEKKRLAHDDIWNAIYKEIGEKHNKDRSLQLNKSYEDLGLYIIEKSEVDVGDLLRSLVGQ